MNQDNICKKSNKYPTKLEKYIKYKGETNPQKIKIILIKISLLMLCVSIYLTMMPFFFMKYNIIDITKYKLPASVIMLIISLPLILLINCIIPKFKIIRDYLVWDYLNDKYKKMRYKQKRRLNKPP